MNDVELDRLQGLEAVLFVADHPLDVPTLATALDCAPDDVDPLLAELDQRLQERQSGLVLRDVAGGWRLYTAAEAREHVERHLLAGRSGRLSQAALETLAVVAYKQPISRTEIGDIRGVNADGAVRSLVSRGLVEEVGRDDGPGQAVLYGTTQAFLEQVGLHSLDDLPNLTDYLVENPAPDEPTPDRLKEARRRLQSGAELASTGSPHWDPDADTEATERAVDQARQARRAAATSRRREQDDEMDDLTGTLEEVARNAMAQLRDAVAATEPDEDESDEPDEAEPDPSSDEGSEPEPPPETGPAPEPSGQESP